VLDLSTNKWIENDFSRDGSRSGLKRVHHAGAILGCVLIIHGGFCGEEKSLYSEMVLFDLYLKRWLDVKVRKIPDVNNPDKKAPLID
jgi:hypothetical protein